MSWLKSAAALAIFLIAVGVGGAAVRLSGLITDLSVGLATGLIGVVLLAVGIVAAKSPEWLSNPYW